MFKVARICWYKTLYINIKHISDSIIDKSCYSLKMWRLNWWKNRLIEWRLKTCAIVIYYSCNWKQNDFFIPSHTFLFWQHITNLLTWNWIFCQNFPNLFSIIFHEFAFDIFFSKLIYNVSTDFCKDWCLYIIWINICIKWKCKR